MILCVDPDEAARNATRDALETGGFAVEAAGTGAEAEAVLRDAEDLECLVTEHEFPDGTGLELIERTRELAPDTACILYTEASLDEIDTERFGGTVAEYLRKGPADADEELRALVEHSLTFHSQTAYPLPANEDARRAALDRYATDTDTLAESLDRTTVLATELFDLDSAAVGLVDAHHERFISCHGASFDTLDREDTICTYTILDDDVTVVENVQDDPRFAENEGLAAAGVTFYAGAPVRTPEGHAIGVLCLHDSVSRRFGDRERELLRALADDVMEKLELRRRLAEATGGERDE